MTLIRLRLVSWLLMLGAVIVVGFFSYQTWRGYLARQAAVRETLSSKEAMVETLSLLKDAETGGRGFLLTGDETFLEPYEAARPKLQTDLALLDRFATDSKQRVRASRVGASTHQKLDILGKLIDLKRQRQLPADDAIAMLRDGKRIMDSIRDDVAAMLGQANVSLGEQEAAAAAITLRFQSILGGALFSGVALALIGLVSARGDAERSRLTSLQLERDVAAKEKAELQLREQSQLLESVLSNLGDAVIVLDQQRTVLVANPVAQRIATYVVGQRLSPEWSNEVKCYLPDGMTVFPPEQGPLTRALQGHPSDGVEMVICVKSGELRSYSFTTRPILEDDKTVAAVAVIRDTTEIKHAEKKIFENEQRYRALSLRDELTGLHNRRGFMEIAEHQLKAAARAGEPCTVFFADLNGMKAINDQLGHEMGDKALRAAAEILTGVFRPSDVVARLGGDEFAIFAGDCDELEIPSTFSRIEFAVGELNAISTDRFRLSISAGAAVFRPEAPRDLLTLMQAADANMYEAKRARHQRGSLRVRSG